MPSSSLAPQFLLCPSEHGRFLTNMKTTTPSREPTEWPLFEHSLSISGIMTEEPHLAHRGGPKALCPKIGTKKSPCLHVLVPPTTAGYGSQPPSLTPYASIGGTRMTSAWVIRSNLSMLVKSIFLGSIPASISVGRTASTFCRPKRGRGDPSPDMKSSSPWVMPTMLALVSRASLRLVCTASGERLYTPYVACCYALLSGSVTASTCSNKHYWAPQKAATTPTMSYLLRIYLQYSIRDSQSLVKDVQEARTCKANKNASYFSPVWNPRVRLLLDMSCNIPYSQPSLHTAPVSFCFGHLKIIYNPLSTFEYFLRARRRVLDFL